MVIHFICVGTRMPAWVQAGYDDYAKRLPGECILQLVEIPLGRRGKGVPVERAMAEEGERMLKAVPKGARVVALDVRGQGWNTEQLSANLEDWMGDGRPVALLVGGPDGLAAQCLGQAEQHWSLSSLTLPHPLVRVVVAEQFYRAWSILRNHPYHRAG